MFVLSSSRSVANANLPAGLLFFPSIALVTRLFIVLYTRQASAAIAGRPECVRSFVRSRTFSFVHRVQRVSFPPALSLIRTKYFSTVLPRKRDIGMPRRGGAIPACFRLVYPRRNLQFELRKKRVDGNLTSHSSVLSAPLARSMVQRIVASLTYVSFPEVNQKKERVQRLRFVRTSERCSSYSSWSSRYKRYRAL